MALTKHGGPCCHCGGTLRWQRSRHCVACDRENARKRMKRNYDALTGPEFNLLLLKRRRTKALHRKAKREAKQKEATEVGSL